MEVRVISKVRRRWSNAPLPAESVTQLLLQLLHYAIGTITLLRFIHPPEARLISEPRSTTMRAEGGMSYEC